MRFSITRKINLSNIDKEIWPYETEDISVSDADSFEEAQQKVDRLVSERMGYYKRISEENKIAKATPQPLPIQPAQPTPIAQVAPVEPAQVQATTTTPIASVGGGVSSEAPAEFNA